MRFDSFQQRHVLMSLGEDEAPSSGLYLKMWDLDKMQPEGSSTTGPACVRSIRVFDNKYPEAQVCEIVDMAPGTANRFPYVCEVVR